jgi:hypothetical protein
MSDYRAANIEFRDESSVVRFEGVSPAEGLVHLAEALGGYISAVSKKGIEDGVLRTFIEVMEVEFHEHEADKEDDDE